MRVSVDNDESGALDPAWFRAQRKKVTIYLNGEPVEDVRTADEEAGYIERLRRDAAGEFVLNESHDGILLERLEGAVRIVVSDDA